MCTWVDSLSPPARGAESLWPWNLAALSANCSWVAFKFIDSLGDVVLPLCLQPIVSGINCGSRFPALVLRWWPGARDQRDAQRERPLRGQERRPLQVPQPRLATPCCSKLAAPLWVSFWHCQLWGPRWEICWFDNSFSVRDGWHGGKEQVCNFQGGIGTTPLNLYLGHQRSAQARHVASKIPFWAPGKSQRRAAHYPSKESWSF